MNWLLITVCFVTDLLLLSLIVLKLNIARKSVVFLISPISLFSALFVNVLKISLFEPAWFQLSLCSIVVVFALFGMVLLFRFYRDPEREIIEKENVILSPADGIVRYVKKIESGSIIFPEKKGRTFPLTEITHTDYITKGSWLVGIEMSIMDVHVNRAPISGKIEIVHRKQGKFLSLRKIESVMENERVTTLFVGEKFSVGVVQIASRLVRRIKVYKETGSQVARGERFGRITFGSQVDVIVPLIENIKVRVNPGQYVKAGETIIAEF